MERRSDHSAASMISGSAGGGVRVEWARTKAAARWLAMPCRSFRRSLEGKVRSPFHQQQPQTAPQLLLGPGVELGAELLDRLVPHL